MAKKLVIKNGVVENIIEADDNFTIEGCEIVDYQEGANIGYQWDGGKVIIPEPEPIPEDVLAEDFRLQRNYLLADTDWWASSDLTMTQEQIEYRQALRDVPNQDGFPFDIQWPTKPE